MIFNILLIITLVICCITDLRVRKIYNKIIFPILFSVFVLQIILNGFSGLKVSLLGFALGIAILIIPFILGGLGAGDVKLLALIGALKGGLFAINTALYMCIIGGAIALIIILFHKETINFIKSLFYFLVGLISGHRYKLVFSTTPFIQKFPYSIAIAGGALISLLSKGAIII
ncbi:A24 family peptidase [Candidatus Clostridium radicumherbarum]|uniref:Prepilin peptidase n=1 Tax=Candidatus Clostridium radicumherbarum TaxID=3381662 RepID=A0ABW8TR68_9CLOT